MTACGCVCWLFHRMYYDARNHKHKILRTYCSSTTKWLRERPSMLCYMYIACFFFASILNFVTQLNLIASSSFFFVNFDFVTFYVVCFNCAVFVPGQQLGGFNAFLGPSTKIYLGALPTGIPEVIMQTNLCKNVPHKPCMTQFRKSNQTFRSLSNSGASCRPTDTYSLQWDLPDVL